MPESYTNVSEGSGKKQHSFQRTIGANTVEDNVVLAGLPYLPTYTAVFSGISTATSASHIIQLMAGASLNVYVLRIVIDQLALATTAAYNEFRLYRLSTAGTGGSAVTANPFDTTAAAAGAAGMTLPSSKGTEGTLLDVAVPYLMQTAGASVTRPLPLYSWQADASGIIAPIRIAAGTSNGIAVKNISATAAATVSGTITFVEASF